MEQQYILVIKDRFRKREHRNTRHAVEQMIKRNITEPELEQAVLCGIVIEDYPHDKYGPSCLILGYTLHGRPLHILCSLPPVVKVITVYEPASNNWDEFKRRRNT